MKSRRFNVIDLIIVLIVVLGIAYIGKKIMKPATTAAGIPVTIEFQSAPTEYYNRDLRLLSTGETVHAVEGGVTYVLGTLAKRSAVPQIITIQLGNGTLKKAVDPVDRLMMLSIDAKAAKSVSGGYLFSNNPLFVGEALYLQIGPLQIGGTVIGITPR